MGFLEYWGYGDREDINSLNHVHLSEKANQYSIEIWIVSKEQKQVVSARMLTCSICFFKLYYIVDNHFCLHT